MSTLLEIASRHIEEIAAIRRDIHANPELGFEELRTSALIASKLRQWGVEVEQGVAGTGVVGTIRGKRGGQGAVSRPAAPKANTEALLREGTPASPAIGLRAEMDALALCELNTLPHASKVQGRMHACGHDGHTAMLLGAAQALAENPDFEGVVHLIFQPAEEGRGGALAMIEDQLFERFPCARIFGMHSHPALPLGTFGTRKDEMMAASGRWEVRFSGTGGHGGANPHLSCDLSVVAAHFMLALQTAVSRNTPPLEPTIISVGHISAGDPKALNVMPAELRISGTMRAFTPAVQKLLERRILEHANAFAATEGATAEVKCWWISVPLVNDRDATETALSAAASVVGESGVWGDLARVTAGEDFSYMMTRRPGSFMLIGNGRHEGDGGDNLHTPRYDFNDKALPVGIAYWLAIVNKELGGRLGTS